MTRLAPGDLNGLPVIVGTGLAGLACALAMAPQPVVVVTKSALGTGCSSVWAQGGIAAPLGTDDCAALHVADTLAAGDGLCVEEAVTRIIAAAPEAIAALESWGVQFDREADGRYCVSLEAAHSRRRVLHAGGGDTAGKSIMDALVARVLATPSIHVLENTEVVRLVTRDGVVRGLVARVEGFDRKSFFAVAESKSGVDKFRFWEKPIELPQTSDPDVNVYDMRLTKHEDGWF